MQKRDSYLLLTVLSVGVFLAGLELMVTAVALPQILATMATWSELRHASWIINAYLLVYVATMPLAGRLTDTWGARRLFLAALAVFTLGSALAGLAQTLDQLIAARVVQALGGGAIIPVATAAASHLFDGPARPRALGIIGALTFLGMAAGPFVGAAILETVHPETALADLSITTGPQLAALAPAWRWVFYVNVPIGIAALAIAWAASYGWETPRHGSRLDVVGALLFTLGLGGLLGGTTLLGSSEASFGDIPLAVVIAALLLVGVVSSTLAIVWGLRRPDPFLDPRLFANRVFSSAALISLLTGYGLATAIVGGAVFVDRVLYGGPDQQRVVLGALAGATAVGALVSGFLTRRFSLRSMSVVGLVASAAGLVWMSVWQPDTPTEVLAASGGLFGFGFGLTVTPRSTAAVEAAGRRAFGAASATVTVARMIGMAVGMAALTAYGSTKIEQLTQQISAPGAYVNYIPAYLRDRGPRDPLVINALEEWASRTAASVMVAIFLVAAVVTLVAVLPAIALRARTRMLPATPGGEAATPGSEDAVGYSEPITL